MVLIRNFIAGLSGLFLFMQCSDEQKSNDTNQRLSPSINSLPTNIFIGEWKYDNTIWYSSELTLQDNGGFTFHDQSCYGQRFSQGLWVNKNGTIQLTSFEIFKDKVHFEKQALIDIVGRKNAMPKLKIDDARSSSISFRNITLPMLPGPDDTMHIFFDKVQLKLVNDTLYCGGKEPLLADAKFYRIRNYR